MVSSFRLSSPSFFPWPRSFSPLSKKSCSFYRSHRSMKWHLCCPIFVTVPPQKIHLSSAQRMHSTPIPSQKHSLRQEVAKAARLTLRFTLTIENLDDKLNVMPGAYLYELWKYHKSVKRNLKSHVEEFIRSCADNTLLGQICVSLSPRGTPRWLDDYLTSIATGPSSFNPIEFHKTLADHTLSKSSSWLPFVRNPCASCSKSPTRT